MPGIPKAVFAERDPELVREPCQLATAQIERFCPKAAEVLEEAEADALSYPDFPYEHHVRLRTNNVQERADRELKRRSRVVQVLPGRRSPIGMMGAVFSEMAGAGRTAAGSAAARSTGRRGRQGQRARARLRGHRGRARDQDHRARSCRQPDPRQEGGAARARMTASKVILGYSYSLRPPSRTDPYTNFRGAIRVTPIRSFNSVRTRHYPYGRINPRCTQ